MATCIGCDADLPKQERVAFGKPFWAPVSASEFVPLCAFCDHMVGGGVGCFAPPFDAGAAWVAERYRAMVLRRRHQLIGARVLREKVVTQCG